MTIPFYKYQGTGNDFVMIDQRQKTYLHRDDQATIEKLCDRRFGIGADGLILLSPPSVLEPDCDFEMVYFNADGRESSMCGNGGRCLVAFAHFLQVFDNQCLFNAVDGLHDARVRADGWVELKMIDVKNVEIGQDYFLMNTGSPHFVVFVEDLSDINIFEAGRQIRYSERFHREGVNVNFVELKKDQTGIEVATYERGVEDETYSCGTGVTAAAIAFALRQNQSAGSVSVPIQTKGGQLEVRFEKSADGLFSEVWLCGPAQQVFAGQVAIED
jgi:diaminopimelate epimerase